MQTQETTIEQPGQEQLYALESDQQVRDILLLYYKLSFSAQSISQIYDLGVEEVEQIISNFAQNFSTEEFMMNVINNIAGMNKRDKLKTSTTPPTSDKDKEIAQLKRQLKEAEIKAEFYEEMIRIAEHKFNIPIRKKAGAKQ